MNAEPKHYLVDRFLNLPPDDVVFGVSETMQEVKAMVQKVAQVQVPVLIQGESGTGKETLARVIHRLHPGDGTPFLRISSTDFLRSVFRALSSISSPPAHSNASEAARAIARYAGTLLISEVADLRPAAQRKLMQLIQDEPLLAMEPSGELGNLRLVSASTSPLEREVKAGHFRRDLFYSISVVSIQLPPLRERREDIARLVRYFWRHYNSGFDCHTLEPSEEMIEFLGQRDWPGNIRELENVVKRYVLLGAEKPIIDELTRNERREPALGYGPEGTISLKQMARQAAREVERKIILRTLQNNHWSRKRTAEALHISYRTLLYKAKEAGVPHKVGRFNNNHTFSTNSFGNTNGSMDKHTSN